MTIDIKLLYEEVKKIREQNPFFTQRTAYDDGIINGIHICCDKLELFLKHYEKFPEKYNVN